MDPLIWALVAAVAIAAIYFVFVRKLLNKPAPAPAAATTTPETKAQPPATP
jgi:hypothetical protein